MPADTVLTLDGLKIRHWRPKDSKSLVLHANDFDVWINVTDRFPHPYTLADADNWIARSSSNPAGTDFAIEIDGQAVGGMGLMMGKDVFRRSAEIGYWLGKAYWGRGYMSKAVTALSAYGFDKLDVIRIYGSVFAWNPASARVLEKCGYTFEGRLKNAITKNGKTTDQLLYAMLK